MLAETGSRRGEDSTAAQLRARTLLRCLAFFTLVTIALYCTQVPQIVHLGSTAVPCAEEHTVLRSENARAPSLRGTAPHPFACIARDELVHVDPLSLQRHVCPALRALEPYGESPSSAATRADLAVALRDTFGVDSNATHTRTLSLPVCESVAEATQCGAWRARVRHTAAVARANNASAHSGAEVALDYTQLTVRELNCTSEELEEKLRLASVERVDTVSWWPSQCAWRGAAPPDAARTRRDALRRFVLRGTRERAVHLLCAGHSQLGFVSGFLLPELRAAAEANGCKCRATNAKHNHCNWLDAPALYGIPLRNVSARTQRNAHREGPQKYGLDNAFCTDAVTIFATRVECGAPCHFTVERTPIEFWRDNELQSLQHNVTQTAFAREYVARRVPAVTHVFLWLGLHDMGAYEWRLHLHANALLFLHELRAAAPHARFLAATPVTVLDSLLHWKYRKKQNAAAARDVTRLLYTIARDMRSEAGDAPLFDVLDANAMTRSPYVDHQLHSDAFHVRKQQHLAYRAFTAIVEEWLLATDV